MNDQSKQTFPKRWPFASSRQILLGTLTLLTLVFVLIIGLRPASTGEGGSGDNHAADQVGSQPNTLVAQGCQIIQKLSYVPCQHNVTRRMDMPTELVGKTRGDVEAAYDTYRVTAFLPNEVTMEQELAMYCAAHVVLLPDESGILCVFENKYGDAYARVLDLELPLSELPAATQEELRLGKAFDDLQALEQWLESAES